MDKNRAKTAMPAIALLVESGATPSSVTATLDLFRIAERFDGSDTFNVDAFSSTGGDILLAGDLRFTTRPLPPALKGYDAVILPGFFAVDVADLIAQVKSVWQPAIQRLRHLAGSPIVAASCYGTFVLAESGLLDGHAATTTWWLQAPFAERFPKVRLSAGQSLVDDGPVITAGAMTAHTDLSLHLLRRLKGNALARQVGAVMLVGEGRASQRPFMTLQRMFADPLVDAAIVWMESHLAAAFSGPALAAAIHVSYRTLHRRFHTITGMAPLAYLQALRVEKAKMLLQETRKSIDQVAADVGYADVSSFRRLFARLTDVTPAHYRRGFKQPGI